MKELVFENCIVRVHVPDLTEEQREARLEEFRRAAGRFMAAVERSTKDEEKNQKCNS